MLYKNDKLANDRDNHSKQKEKKGGSAYDKAIAKASDNNKNEKSKPQQSTEDDEVYHVET